MNCVNLPKYFLPTALFVDFPKFFTANVSHSTVVDWFLDGKTSTFIFNEIFSNVHEVVGTVANCQCH